METLTEIYNELQEMGTHLFSGSYDLPEDCDAATIKFNGVYGVFLDIEKIRTLAQEKEAVSHEWAHITEDATYHIDAPPDVKRRAEVRANRAQIKRVLPWSNLCQAVYDGCDTPYLLSERFNLSEPFIQSAIDFYLGPCGYCF